MSHVETCIDKIRELVNRDGYIYSFLMTVIRDCFYNILDPEEYEARDKLITEELLTLLGFWVQVSNFSYPKHFEELYQMMKDADSLMKELHQASYERVNKEMSEIIKSSIANNPTKSLSNEAKADSIHEAIYYSGDAAYDFEYVHFLTKKYKYDLNWLEEHKGFNPEEAAHIALKIKEILHQKTEILCFPNRSLDFKELGFELEDDFKMALEFGTFMNLIPLTNEDSDENEIENALHSFCDSLLDLFTIEDKQLFEFSGGQNFLNLFATNIAPGINSAYKKCGDYNIFQATPIIRLNEQKYFIPIVYQLFVSLYETPFYWIISDDHYRKTAGSHRGSAGEEMAFEILEPVFGKEKIFRDIEIKDSKHHTITDIDTLCIIGSKAICIQVKSKKLSYAARTGSIDNLTDDFKKAVQDAYGQGLLCRQYLLNQSGVYFWSKEKQERTKISDEINEVYIVCLTTENYPALIHQVHELLQVKEGDPTPLVISIFDLRLISHYLDNPYKFTYYVRQRIKTNAYYYSDNEMNYLAYHLLHKLYPNPEYKREYIDRDFASQIDKDYYPFISGRRSSLEEGELKRKWENKAFDELCNCVAQIENAMTVDIMFFLYDLSSESREELIESLNYCKQRSKANNTIVNIRAIYDYPEEITGITIVAVQPFSDLYKDIYCIGELHKYHHKANKWLTLGVYNTSKSMVDMLLYTDRTWVEDPILERISKKNLGNR